MKLLFHCCCAPCTVGCVDSLAAENIAPQLLWYGPNIHPYTEYKNRRDTLVQFAAAHNLDLTMVDEYGLRPFIRSVYPVMEDGPAAAESKRCAYCYRLRLEKTAAIAVETGCDAFSTSLLISPWQDHDAIRCCGETLAAQYGVAFLYRDFRPRFRPGQERARQLGLYMQKYCGCIFSEEERYLQQVKKTAGIPA